MVTDSLPAMPFDRENVLDVAPMYLALQGEQPVTRVRTPAGDIAWLVTGYEQVKTLMDEEGLGRAHPDPERAPRFTDSAIIGGPIGDYQTEKADHARLRRLLTQSFMVKRMNALRPHVQAIVDELLEAMAGGPRPADLHEALSFPLPILVICELLGVPYEDRERFRIWADQCTNMFDRQVAMAGFGALRAYMSELIERKRTDPGEDVISDLVDAQGDEDRFSDGFFVDICCGLLFAGHETTMARIDLGTVLLLTHPDELEALHRDPSLLHGAVEEILRMSAPAIGIARYANADLDVDGFRIRAGELVIVSPDTANRDARVFPDPARFDIRRAENRHVAFGYGRHFCLGAGLARVELQTVFGTLFQRLPTLRLAVPIGELRNRPHSPLGGLIELPVTW